jgi:hypothetical protein
MDKRHITDEQQVLSSLSREGTANRKETSVVVNSGAVTTTWPVKIKSHVAWNVYRVRAVVLGSAGMAPAEIGDEIEATNLAESFLSQGTLPAGTFAIMFRTGEQGIFYAKP